ncbi:MAG: helicase, partial [Candidatus Pacebacteria bacterium]|nr:helicase [Candidatus Paceibacterota bacterium]
IATVDKFAAMPWVGQVGSLFGKVTSSDPTGFYGPSDGKNASPLVNGLRPPDLIIQDELHLISGPMGTMVGLYETAINELCSTEIDGKKVLPKIIASTATIRRADKQIKALFGRDRVDIFPPPGPDIRDSFFAITKNSKEVNARSYIGIAAQGRSTKMLFLKSTVALMSAAQKLYKENGAKKNKENPVDPYMTLLGYFNSLRELGGSRRIIEDEVKTRLSGYWNRKRISIDQDIFENRNIRLHPDYMELTSRVSTNDVAATKRRLSQPYHSDESLDVVLATNMISVGLDITRLGLMVVMGQPKTSAEYIQSTSRVGRDPSRPGLVVTLYNIHRHRDRSIYERFCSYHQSFYREVEATSVTPFSPRALDRGLAGTVLALTRHIDPNFNPPTGANKILDCRPDIEKVIEILATRAKSHDKDMGMEEADKIRQHVRDRVVDLLDEWAYIAHDCKSNNTTLQYQKEEGGAKKRLLYDFLDPEMDDNPDYKFKANRSMRDVEPSVNLFMRQLTRKKVSAEANNE